MEVYVSAFSKVGYFYSIIQKCCKSYRFSISKARIGNFINEMGKNHHTLASEGKNFLNTHIKKKEKTKNFPLFKESKESFSKGFMTVVGFSYKHKKKVRKVDKNVKINSKYYQEHVLTS